MRWLVALFLLPLLSGLAATEEINGIPVPPSPADPIAHPGLHLWDLPRITHWPAIIFVDEARNCAFHLPVPPRQARSGTPPGLGSRASGADHDGPPGSGISTDPRTRVGWAGGDHGTIGWRGGPRLPVVLPDDPETTRCSGLLDLPEGVGRFDALVEIADGSYRMSLRIVPCSDPWPHADLVNGYPVDEDGVPVVLSSVRPDPAAQRRFAVLRRDPVRPRGPAVVIGDPLASPGGDVFAALSGVECRALVDTRYPHHAAVVALAPSTRLIDATAPRTICWSPGNAPLYANTVGPEEGRFLEVVRERYRAVGLLPRLLLLLPPLPAEAELHELAERRRTDLRSTAAFNDWEVLDAAALLTGHRDPNALAPGLTARYPVGEARAALVAGLQDRLLD